MKRQDDGHSSLPAQRDPFAGKQYYCTASWAESQQFRKQLDPHVDNARKRMRAA